MSEVTNDLLNFAGKPNIQINWLRASHFSWETNLCEQEVPLAFRPVWEMETLTNDGTSNDIVSIVDQSNCPPETISIWDGTETFPKSFMCTLSLQKQEVSKCRTMQRLHGNARRESHYIRQVLLKLCDL